MTGGYRRSVAPPGEPSDLVAVVLCGGRGTRALPHTLELPKPLLDVGGRPILRHVLDIYADQGCRRFVLAAGYLAERVREFADTLPRDLDITVVDTGVDTGTGARVLACREHMGATAFVTYGDGVGDIDLRALLAFHASHDGAATLTTVPLRSPFGTVELTDAGAVARFREKPVIEDHLINAGFFVFDAAAFEHWSGPDLERDVLPALADQGQLYAYRHAGFWRSMDSHKDALELTALYEEGGAPWTISGTRASS